VQSFSCTKTSRDGLVVEKNRVKWSLLLDITSAKSHFSGFTWFGFLQTPWSRDSYIIRAVNVDASCTFSFLLVFLLTYSIYARLRVCFSVLLAHGKLSGINGTYSHYSIDRPTYYTSTFFLLLYSPRSSSPVSNCSQLDPRNQSINAHARFPIISLQFLQINKKLWIRQVESTLRFLNMFIKKINVCLLNFSKIFSGNKFSIEYIFFYNIPVYQWLINVIQNQHWMFLYT